MTTAAASSPSPPTSPPLMTEAQTHALLADFLSAALPLEGLAGRHNLTLPQLLDWIESPATQALLARFAAASEVRARAMAQAARPAAMLALSELVHRFLYGDTHYETARKAAARLLTETKPASSARTNSHETPARRIARRPTPGRHEHRRIAEPTREPTHLRAPAAVEPPHKIVASSLRSIAALNGHARTSINAERPHGSSTLSTDDQRPP